MPIFSTNSFRDNVTNPEIRKTLEGWGAIFNKEGKNCGTRRSALNLPKLTYIKPGRGGDPDQELILPGDLSSIKTYLLKGFKIHPKHIPPFATDPEGIRRIKALQEKYAQWRKDLADWEYKKQAGETVAKPQTPYELGGPEEVPETPQFECKECGKSFPSKISLGGHTGSAHRKKDKVTA